MNVGTLEIARFNMIQQQIRPWNLLDNRVLEVIEALPREAFTPPLYQGLAYADLEIPLAHGERMLAPKIAAKALQALALKPADRVLEIGTGSGYVTACLARLAAQVISMERHGDFVSAARERLEGLGIRNVEWHVGDALQGELPGAPYDAILVNGSLPRLDPRLNDALLPGGRLFVVIGESPLMEAKLITRVRDDQWRTEILFETELPPLTDRRPQGDYFSF
jgi:protein-L-isoaspartate(D-aspartate) O-methyltransferase